MQRLNPLVLFYPQKSRGYGQLPGISWRHGLIFLLVTLLWALWYYWHEVAERTVLVFKDPPFYLGRSCDFSWEGMRPADCGYLYVKEDRSKPDSQIFRLPVAIFRSEAPIVQPDPVVYIPGGPGFAALLDAETTEWFWQEDINFRHWLVDRDLVLFDPRGIGGSRPSADCPFIKILISYASSDERQHKANTKCLMKVRELGFDPGLFTSVIAAKDLSDLRRALGLTEWNLWGESYGTRIALSAMALHPEGIRTAILSGVYPPHIPKPQEIVKFPALIGQLIRTCQIDEQCNERFPALNDRFLSLLKTLHANPVTVVVPLTRKARNRRFKLDDVEFLNIIFFLLYLRAGAEEFPSLVDQIENQNYDTVVEYLDWIDYLNYGPWTSGGAMWATVCNEEPRWDTPAIAQATETHPQFSGWYRWITQESLCDMLSWPLVTTAVMEPVESDIPTLLISGYWDPTTPTEWARSAVEYLDNGHLYVFTGYAHDASDSPCAMNIIARFLREPSRVPDHDCYEDQPPLTFER